MLEALDSLIDGRLIPTSNERRPSVPIFRGALGFVRDIDHLTSHGQLELNCQLILLRPRCLINFRENHTSIIQLMPSLFRVPGSEFDCSGAREENCRAARLHN